MPGVLVDENYQVLHVSETAWRYLAQPAGPPTEDLLRLARPEMQMALQRAFEHHSNAETRPIAVQLLGSPHLVTVLVRPGTRHRRALVQFWESDEIEAPAGESAAAGGQDKRIVEFEQELQLVNQELKGRMEEIAAANSDLQNLFAATEIATLFLDRELRVKRFTPRAAELAAAAGVLRIQVSDRGKGFDPSAQAGETSSQGLQRAEQRLHLIGGRVQVQSQPGDGTRVVIHAPLQNGTIGAGSAQPMNG